MSIAIITYLNNIDACDVATRLSIRKGDKYTLG